MKKVTKAHSARADVPAELRDQVIELTRHFALWWFFLNKENARRYGRVEGEYPEFFITLADSLRQSFFIATCRLFDKRNDVISLRGTILDLESSNKTLADELMQKVTAAQPVLDKVTRLRHEVFAHRNRHRSPQNAFAVVKITPKEMEEVLRLAQEIITTSTSATGAQTKVEEELQRVRKAVEADAFDLMQVLDKHTE